jgi:adenylate cyclase
MSNEIELKLTLAESLHHHFLRLPILKRAVSRQSHQLINLYYDTPQLDLRQRGIALRLRAKGKLWLQTVKCAGQAAGGLSVRPEWEIPYLGHFDFSGIDHDKVRHWLDRPKLRTRIAPIFETNFRRIAWQFEPTPDTRIELVLDRGWIAAAGQRLAISEIEIELLAGDPVQLFHLAHSLAERVALSPAPLSKADRGYRLFKQELVVPVKASAIALTATDDPAAAFGQIALACLDHLQQNHQGAITSDNPEYIHQMRVATRRIRAALRLFSPLLPANFAAAISNHLRELMDVLGQARDLDVLLTEIAAPVLQALPDEPRLAALVGVITERRFDRRQTAVDLLRSPRFGAHILAVLDQLYQQLNTTKVGAGETVATLADFASNRLQRLRQRVLKLARQARIDDPPTLHALRISIKRLRYALEFFAPLTSPKAMRRLLGHLISLQETLGQINDLANAGELLMGCAHDDPRLREAVTLIGGWHGPRHQQLLEAVPPGLKHLGRLRLPQLPG